MKKNKYLIFREKPYNMGETVAQVNVSDLNKRGIQNKWNELESIFPKETHQSSLTECNNELREFIEKPKSNI